jgi:hypothetical protein
MPFSALTPGLACEELATAGFRFDPERLTIEPRDGRWLARLPGRRMAWFAASASGHAAMATERRVLRLLEARCGFRVPQVLFECPSGEFDVRTAVEGRGDPATVYDVVKHRADVAQRIGTTVGTILAEQHACIDARDAASWLPRRPGWPEPREWILERLPDVVENEDLRSRADAVICAYESIDVADDDRVLAHTDVGLHNLAIDAESYAVNGVFDYEGAAWTDRHQDFRYLVLDAEPFDLFDAAARVYEKLTGRPIDRDRVLMYNAACAVSFLAYRAGHAPDERWCGRTLAEDLRWSTTALERVHLC